MTNLGTAGFGYGATGGFSLTNIAPGGVFTIMGGQGAKVYPGIIAWGGDLSIGGNDALTASVNVVGPVGSSVGNTTIFGQGTINVASSGVVSAAGTASLTTIGAYTQSAGLVNAPVVAINATAGITITGGAIAASNSVSVFPDGATTTVALTPSISLTGSGITLSAGSIAAIGSGAQVSLVSQNAGDITLTGGSVFSGGDIRFGNPGTGSGAVGSVSGFSAGFGLSRNVVQSGGTVAAVGNVSLWVDSALTQTGGIIAAGGTLGASVFRDITQGTAGGIPGSAEFSGSTVRLFSATGAATQLASGLVRGGQGLASAVDPLGYPVQIMSPAGANSFTNFDTPHSVAAAGGYVVFSPASNVTAAAGLVALPAVPGASITGPAAYVAPDVVLLGDTLNLTAHATARYLALYSRTATNGSVTATLLTGRAGVPVQDATALSPYPLPDIVRSVETTNVPGGGLPFWSTAASTGNVTLTASAVDNLGTIVVPGTSGYGYGTTGSFSLDNTAPSGILMVMGGGTAGSNVYPGVIAGGGDLTITQHVGGGTGSGSIEVRGPLAASGTLTVTALGDMKITQSAVLSAGNTAALSAAGTYTQDSGLVTAPTITLNSNLASGNAVVISGGTVSATGVGGQLRITTPANVVQSGGVIASDNGLTIGTGSGAGTAAGTVVATTDIVQSGGTLAAVGNMALYAGGQFHQTGGVIAAGGTLAATATGRIIQGNLGQLTRTTTAATMSGGTVRLFSTTAGADQGGDALVAGGANVSVDPSLYPIRIQAPKGGNGFAIFGTAATVTAGGALFSPASNLGATTPAAAYQALTAYTPATVGATSATRPDVALLGGTIGPNTGTITANNLALYSFGDTNANVVAKLLTGRAGVLTLDSTATPDFVVPALVATMETVNSPATGTPYWSRASNHTGNFYLPNNVTNGGTANVSAVQNLGTTVGGVNYGLGATGSINLDNKAPGGTLTVMGGLMSWAGGVRINNVGSADTMLVVGDVNVASPGASVALSGTTVVAGLLSLTSNSITLGKSGSAAGGSVTLQAAMLEITGKASVNVLDGVTIDTAGDTFTRPLAGSAPKDPQKTSTPPAHMPGALFTAGLGGFTQTGTFTMQPYTPTAYKLSGPAYTPATHPVLDIVLSAQTGTIAFDPATGKGLAAPKVAIVLDVGAGNATGRIDADTLALFYTQQTGPSSYLTGTLRTALGIAVSDQAAATQAFIAQNGNYVPSNHFQMNGCALSSVNCVLTSLFPQVIVTNPFKDIVFARIADSLDDPDLLLPNVTDRDY